MFHREINAHDAPCDIVRLTLGEIADLDQLATGLVPPSRLYDMSAMFWSHSEKMGFGRLGPVASGVDGIGEVLRPASTKSDSPRQLTGSGFATTRFGNREKSRSADQSTRTP